MWKKVGLVAFLAAALVGCSGSGPIGHRFTNPEKLSKRWDNPSRDEWQNPNEVITAMDIQEGMTVVDLGAGTGYFVPHLARAVGATGKVLALDVEEPMVAHLSARFEGAALTNASAKLVPYEDPQLQPGSVDRILVVNTWHHIRNRGQYAAKLAAGLKKGGAVVIVDYAKDYDGPGPPMHIRLSLEKVSEELAAGGLKAEVLTETLPKQYIIVGRK